MFTRCSATTLSFGRTNLHIHYRVLEETSITSTVFFSTKIALSELHIYEKAATLFKHLPLYRSAVGIDGPEGARDQNSRRNLYRSGLEGRHLDVHGPGETLQAGGDQEVGGRRTGKKKTNF